MRIGAAVQAEGAFAELAKARPFPPCEVVEALDGIIRQQAEARGRGGAGRASSVLPTALNCSSSMPASGHGRVTHN
jgi:hypothetical protein